MELTLKQILTIGDCKDHIEVLRKFLSWYRSIYGLTSGRENDELILDFFKNNLKFYQKFEDGDYK